MFKDQFLITKQLPHEKIKNFSLNYRQGQGEEVRRGAEDAEQDGDEEGCREAATQI